MKTEIIDGHLWITYSDDLENPVDLGRVMNPEYEGTEGLEFYLLPDGTYGVKAGLTRYLENIVIPSTYNGKAVTKILPDAFKEATYLKNIIIPSTINEIGSYAFYGCTQLETELVLPNGITKIPTYAFYGCTSLEKVTIPSTVDTIEPYAFASSGINDIVCEEYATWNYTVSPSKEYSYYQNGYSGTRYATLSGLQEYTITSSTQFASCMRKNHAYRTGNISASWTAYEYKWTKVE